MTVKQISVFVENKIGGLATITDLLAQADVNIRALSIAETSDFGILRLMVDDVFKASLSAVTSLSSDTHFTGFKADVIGYNDDSFRGYLVKLCRISYCLTA